MSSLKESKIGRLVSWFGWFGGLVHQRGTTWFVLKFGSGASLQRERLDAKVVRCQDLEHEAVFVSHLRISENK